MRRVLLIFLVLAGFGMLVWVLRQPRAARDTDAVADHPSPEKTPDAGADEPAEPAMDVAPERGLEDRDPAVMEVVGDAVDEPTPADDVSFQAERLTPMSRRLEESDELVDELARIRRDVVERVDRQALFVMAEQRGVPYFRLFFMDKPELFEAVLEAEGVPPADVLPSAETAERVRALAAEALSRDEEMALDETDRRAG